MAQNSQNIKHKSLKLINAIYHSSQTSLLWNNNNNNEMYFNIISINYRSEEKNNVLVCGATHPGDRCLKEPMAAGGRAKISSAALLSSDG